MAKFIQFLISVTLVFTIVFLVNVNSVPTTNSSSDVIPPLAEITSLSNGSDCNNHGQILTNETSCDCDRGWTTHGNGNDTSNYCNYQQRFKKTAFFLSFFAGTFGVDWFYLSRAKLLYIVVGILKLLVGFGCCGSWPLTYFGPQIQNSESVKSKFRGVSTCFSLLAFSWWFVDWTRILTSKFPDGNGVGLTSW
jgi:hypothetical protein